jgi:hypothetical protein
VEEEKSTNQKKTLWAIDLDWLQQNNRSISVIITDYLCPRCAKQLSTEKKESSLEALMTAIQNCCCHAPNFINDRLPISESVFRLFLSNGNKPLDLEELGHQLSQLRGGDPYRTSPETLSHLLKNDRYYGLQEISK